VNVLVVGSGGREHALAWRIAQSPSLTSLHAAPGNPGIAALGTCHPVHAEDGEGLLTLARSLDAQLVVVGPEAPLVAGVGDTLRHAGLTVFGPSARAARIEGSKSFAKEVLGAAGVPTAAAVAVARPPCVVKADGLTAGKGVFVCRTQDELDAALRAVSGLGDGVVIEELLEGKELSFFGLVDGQNVLALPEARDYSRVGEGDTGPNTGGMGCFSPVSDAPDPRELVDLVIAPVVEELARRGSAFVGCLYAGLMLTDDGPRVLEFNCRFGDPETQSLLPRLEGDLLAALKAAATGELSGVELAATEEAAVTVVLAGGSYPQQPDSGSPIEGVDAAEAEGALVFHAGTALRDGRLVTNGGRILGVTGVAESVAAARDLAYRAAGRISFPGVRYRRDIAEEAAHVAR
jgi:phosphoribosylamine--glycine ligase